MSDHERKQLEDFLAAIEPNIAGYHHSTFNQHLKVLPVIVTTKTREEIKSELDFAHKNGALVATIEDFQQMINRTLLYPNSERLFAEGEETLRGLQNPPMLPGLQGFK